MVDASPRTPRILKQTRSDSLRRLIMLICYVWSPFIKCPILLEKKRLIAIYFNKKGRNLNLQKDCCNLAAQLWTSTHCGDIYLLRHFLKSTQHANLRGCQWIQIRTWLQSDTRVFITCYSTDWVLFYEMKL